MKNYTVAILEGDGIGPEIMAEAIKVLKVIEQRNNLQFDFQPALFGASAWFAVGNSFPDESKAICDNADIILKGTVGLGLQETKQIPIDEQPERGAILPLRKRYDTFANFRPVYLPPALAHFSPLKREIIGEGIDIMIVRELVGGIYFGEKELGTDEQGQRYAKEILAYDEMLISRIARVAFETAMKRNKRLHSIHKSNVMKSSVLWSEIVHEIHADYPEVEVHDMLVDAAATHLCLRPNQFDVMVMENLFGDILSDQAGGLLGSLGLMPSACIGPKKSYYEPSHGSAPDIAGKNIANPYAMIGSIAMMLDRECGLPNETKNIYRAMDSVFEAGYSTADLSAINTRTNTVNTCEFGDLVVDALNQTD